MAHYIDAALPSASKAEYSRLGKDLEEYIVEMNANVETKNNIWGETSVNLDSYQPRHPLTRTMLRLESRCLTVCRPLWMKDRLDDLKTSVVEVHLVGTS